ncbi:MAG: ferrous iron transport protein A [Deltaproteobacteria bacterium]|nr:ferrous iron transport protein A [bacterium]MCB9475521.1 ferrous iron transport protein A [Deltaproteobacteria bacterium]MCB9488476.1 ferrous iron transport protein A [Deltaproteobacteria bacterium]
MAQIPVDDRSFVTNELPSRTLRDCRKGDCVQVLGLTGTGAYRHRLMEMGFVPGAIVRVDRRAPLADPIIFYLKNYKVSLRSNEAAMVRVCTASDGRH